MKNKKLPYEDAELEIVFFSAEDIVTTSSLTDGNVDTGDGAWV